MTTSRTSLSPQSRRSPMARWAQETFSRESILAGLKTLVWLVPLTLLIWIYAERSQQVTSLPQTIPIEVRSSDPNRFFVDLRMPENDRSVIAKLQGPQAQVDQVSKTIAPESNNPSVVLTISATEPGVVELDAAKLLSLNPIFTKAGVSVFDCKPSTLKVVVDEMADDEAEVKVRPDQQSQIAQPVFTPPKVKLRGPSNDIKAAKSRGPLVVYADIDKSLLQQPGQHNDLTLQVQSDQFTGKPAIVLATTKVNASFEVRPSEFTSTVTAIPIKFLLAPDINNNYKVEIKGGIKAVSNVPVIGPQDKVEELVKANPIAAYAMLEIKLGDEVQSAIPVIHLPDPLVRVDSSYTPKEISYTVKKQDSQP